MTITEYVEEHYPNHTIVFSTCSPKLLESYLELYSLCVKESDNDYRLFRLDYDFHGLIAMALLIEDWQRDVFIDEVVSRLYKIAVVSKDAGYHLALSHLHSGEPSKN